MTQDSITNMLNKPYGEDLQGQNKKFICWHFCRKVYSVLGIQLKAFFHQQELKRIETPVVPCIVLFCAGVEWHGGVVWPDGLHFIHAWPRDIFDPEPKEFIARKDRLTIWPYNSLIEGYYRVV